MNYISEDIFDASLFLVTGKQDIVDVHEYRGPRVDGRCLFIMLTSDALNQEYGEDNSFLVSMDRLDGIRLAEVYRDGFLRDLGDTTTHDRGTNSIKAEFQWQYDWFAPQQSENFEDEHAAVRDFNGRRHTSEILSRAKTFMTCHADMVREIPDYRYVFPAVSAAVNAMVPLGGRHMRGFMPSLGQMMVIERMSGLIYDTVEELDIVYGTPNTHTYWTSTSGGEHTMWCLRYGEQFGFFKTATNRVFPVFGVADLDIK